MKFLMGFSLFLLPLCAFDAPQEFPKIEEQEVAEVVAAPGSYAPSALINAGMFYLEKKDFEKAATLCMGGLGRLVIDMRLDTDRTSGVLPSFYMMQISEVAKTLSPDEREAFQSAYAAAIKNFKEWDSTTPRDYWLDEQHRPFYANDLDAIRYIPEQVYSELAGEEIVGIDGEYVDFDLKTRLFTLLTESEDFYESGISFTLPEGMTVGRDAYAQWANFFKCPNGAVLWLNEGEAEDDFSFEEEYNFHSSCHKDDPDVHDFSIEKCTIGDGIKAFHVRYIDKEGVNNEFHFFKGEDSFAFELTCSEADEAALLSQLRDLLQTVKFVHETF